MEWKEAVSKISSAKNYLELEDIREDILYNKHELDKGEMFLLGEYIQFRKDTLWGK